MRHRSHRNPCQRGQTGIDRKWECELKLTEGWIRNDPFTIYFDVMPATIGDFSRWRAIKALDSDDDGINNTDEKDTDTWKWDVWPDLHEGGGH